MTLPFPPFFFAGAAAPPIGAVTGLSVTKAAIDAISGSWSTATSAAGYEYRYREGAGAFTGWIDNGASTSFSDVYPGSGFTPGATITVEARAYDAEGNRGTEDSDSVVLDTINAPTIGSITVVAENALTFTWTPPGAGLTPTRYSVEGSNSTGTGFAELAEDDASPYTESGLGPSQTRYYRVRAERDSAVTSTTYQSSPSGEVSGTTDIESFEILSQDESGTSDAVMVLVSEPPATTPFDYRVYYRVGSSMSGDPVANGTLYDTYLQSDDPSIEDEYKVVDGFSLSDVVYLIVLARNSSGVVIAQSDEVSETVVEDAPSAPTSVELTGWSEDTGGAPIDPFLQLTYSGGVGEEVELRSRVNSGSTPEDWESAFGIGSGGCIAFDGDEEGLDDTLEWQARIRNTNTGGESAWVESGWVTDFDSEFGTPTCDPTGGT